MSTAQFYSPTENPEIYAADAPSNAPAKQNRRNRASDMLVFVDGTIKPDEKNVTFSYNPATNRARRVTPQVNQRFQTQFRLVSPVSLSIVATIGFAGSLASMFLHSPFLTIWLGVFTGGFIVASRLSSLIDRRLD